MRWHQSGRPGALEVTAPSRSAWRRPRDERGATLVLVAGGMVALLGMAALAIDVGVLRAARTEAQRVADASALAGAGILLHQPTNEALARQTAIDYAAENDIRDVAAEFLPEDVDVDLAAGIVRVRVHLTAARGNPVRTYFARVLGIGTVDVATHAAAEVAAAGAANCPLPVALPDKWIDDGDDIWEPGIDTYVPWRDPATGDENPSYTGYSEADIGILIEIKTAGSGGGGPPGGGDAGGGGGSGNSSTTSSVCVNHPSWRCWYQPGGGGGGVNALRPYIYPGCPDPSLIAWVGEVIEAASGAGNKQSLVIQDFPLVVASDPDAAYDPGCKCIVGGQGANSPRIRLMPAVDPTQVSGTGANVSAPIANFVAVFVEKVSAGPDLPHGSGAPGQWNVYVRFLGFQSGLNPIDGSATQVKALRLIE